jgi:hypothetical protein
LIFAVTNLYVRCGVGFCVFLCGLKIINVCLPQENIKIQSKLQHISSKLIINTVVFMVFRVMCMKYVVSRDIYLIIIKDATSLPCLLSTCPTDNQTNKSARLLLYIIRMYCNWKKKATFERYIFKSVTGNNFLSQVQEI